MKVQEAIKTLEANGFTFIKKKSPCYAEPMEYYFRTPLGTVQFYSLSDLRKRAEREQRLAWNRAQIAELEQGIQLELF